MFLVIAIISLKIGSTFIFAGPTSCGKTVLATDIIRNKEILFDYPPEKVFVVCSNRQKVYDELLSYGIIDKIYHELPNLDELKGILHPFKKSGSLLLLDDLIQGV